MAFTKEQRNKSSAFFTRPQDYIIRTGSVGDVSNVCFTNGCIVKDDNVYICHASSDTKPHVASTTVEKLIDYTFNTPEDPLRSVDCVKQRRDLIDKNIKNGAMHI